MSFPASAESSLPPSGGTRGDLQSPHTASDAGNIVSRVVRVPLERPDDAGWRDLVALARESAQLANRLLIAWAAEAFGWPRPSEPSAVVQFKGRLSGDAYSAVTGEAKGAWQRLRAKVLRGDQRLPMFAADRSLVVRGQYAGGKGGIRIQRDGDGYCIRLLLRGKDHGGWNEFRVWESALKKDRYLSGLLMRMASGDYRCSKATVAIDVRRRKLYALCAYDRPVPTRASGQHTATLGPLEADGSLLLRSARQTRDWTREVFEIRSKKEHFEGIIRRFRRSVGRGPRWRQVYRRNMPTTYEDWAAGKLHQLSIAMVQWLVLQGVSSLTIRPMGDGDWPAHRLVAMLQYKAQHVGITVDVTDEPLATDDNIRADAGPARKEQKKATRVRQVARLVKSDLAERRKGRANGE